MRKKLRNLFSLAARNAGNLFRCSLSNSNQSIMFLIRLTH